MTIDELISELKTVRSQIGGEARIAVDGAAAHGVETGTDDQGQPYVEIL
jgi:hypothetical protein